jgi:hypothetical protein
MWRWRTVYQIDKLVPLAVPRHLALKARRFDWEIIMRQWDATLYCLSCSHIRGLKAVVRSGYVFSGLLRTGAQPHTGNLQLIALRTRISRVALDLPAPTGLTCDRNPFTFLRSCLVIRHVSAESITGTVKSICFWDIQPFRYVLCSYLRVKPRKHVWHM